MVCYYQRQDGGLENNAHAFIGQNNLKSICICETFHLYRVRKGKCVVLDIIIACHRPPKPVLRVWFEDPLL